MTDLEKVQLFHEVFGVPVLDTPRLPDLQRVELRIRLLQEELDETRQSSLVDNDMVATADGLADLLYILLGTVLEFGLGEHFERVFDIVHESNMTKVCDDEETADRTIDHYKTERGVEAYKEECDLGWIVRRSDDHKILKSIAYAPAEPVIAKLLKTE